MKMTELRWTLSKKKKYKQTYFEYQFNLFPWYLAQKQVCFGSEGGFLSKVS